MANICTFRIEINGDPHQLQAVIDFLQRGVEEIPDGTFEKYILNIDRLYHDLKTRDHKFVWLDDGTPCTNDAQLIKEQGPIWLSADRTRMILHGTSRHAPPGPLVERLSSTFPDLEFTYGGTTEHEISENWTCKGGVSKCEWYVEEDILAEKEMWHVRDGQPVGPLEWIDKTPSRLPRAGCEDESDR